MPSNFQIRGQLQNGNTRRHRDPLRAELGHHNAASLFAPVTIRTASVQSQKCSLCFSFHTGSSCPFLNRPRSHCSLIRAAGKWERASLSGIIPAATDAAEISSSIRIARSRVKGPTLVRRRADRCAPLPSLSPTSEANCLMYVPLEQQTSITASGHLKYCSVIE